ncbi:TIPRL [Bugula neritina]|uniref:TIPRL n=1 Tax=Bugula neritina TaxID=10212 RepID=A0A7J7K6J4_BUGNE|nr:TIPRL [Bugula neritina]
MIAFTTSSAMFITFASGFEIVSSFKYHGCGLRAPSRLSKVKILYFLLLSTFRKVVSPLSQTPEMTSDQNILRVTHTEGFGVEFSALDALKLVNAEKNLMKVAVSEA